MKKRNGGAICQMASCCMISSRAAMTCPMACPAAPAAELQDPTGCGDAYRSGLLYGLMKGMDWETTGRIAALMGAAKIEYAGTQNHSPSLQQLEDRFHAAFGYHFN